MIDTGTLNDARDAIRQDMLAIVLVDSTDTVVSEPAGFSPLDSGGYSWDTTTDGKIGLPQDIDFNIDAGVEVAGWRAKNGSYDDMIDEYTLDAGFIIGEDFNTSVNFSSAGVFTLEATSTYVQISLV